MDTFKIRKAHKLMDWIENEVTEWAIEAVTNHFGCEVSEMTLPQVEEVIAEMNEYDDWVYTGLRNVVNIWENENDEYLI